MSVTGRINVQQLSMFSINEENKSFSAICNKLRCENSAPAWPDRFGRSITEWLDLNRIPKIRTLSLFTGAGGLDIGFSDVGFDIVESVEIERKFCDTLELNTGEGKRFVHSRVNCVDIREFSGKNLGSIDFIIGGPPCQTFSAAGRRANGVVGTGDERGVLFREYVRLLRELAPQGFLFENVYGIVGAQGGKAWREITEAFSEAGYQLFYRILDAADYGVPQHRERMIIVGLREGSFRFPRPTHGPDSLDEEPFYNAKTAIAEVPVSETMEANRLNGRFASLLDNIPPGLNYSFYTEEMGHPNPVFAWRSKFSDFLYKADPDLPVRTIKASGGAYTGPLHWDNRFFTLEEYKRLQTFPDDYQISGNKQTAVKQIGNSVPPQLARILAIAIRQQVFQTHFPFELSLLDPNEKLTFRKRKRELTEAYREKAKTAILRIQEEKRAIPDSCQYYCALSDTFKFSETDRKHADFLADVRWGEILSVVVSEPEQQCERKERITISAKNQNWALNVCRVELDVRSEKKLAFTTAWRAFERELSRNAIKADLVQLNGYYQYEPKLVCRFETYTTTEYGGILRSIVEGNEVSRLVSTKELSCAWGLPLEKVIDAAEYLKSIGYEIRNHATNPQIAEGYWLIPYAFPTLTNLSVQLWKKLR